MQHDLFVVRMTSREGNIRSTYGWFEDAMRGWTNPSPLGRGCRQAGEGAGEVR
jgi:hypothetical protein